VSWLKVLQVGNYLLWRWVWATAVVVAGGVIVNLLAK
jgi:hypothetical protein